MRVLLAVDLHHSGRDAVVAEGVRWTQALGATLDLAFVDEYDYSAYLIRDAKIRELVVAEWEEVKQGHRDELTRLISLIPASVRGEGRYLTGRARDALTEASTEYGALLIATHGRKGLGHFFLGSVAEAVIRNVTVPVIVLRLPAPAED